MVVLAQCAYLSGPSGSDERVLVEELLHLRDESAPLIGGENVFGGDE